MSLETNYSMVADSTLASSPQREASSPIIKRSTRTYGRKKDPTPDRDVPMSSSYSHPKLERSIHRTAPPNLAEWVDASSDNEEVDNADAGSKHDWGWKKLLRDLDEDSDNERRPGTNETGGFGEPSLLSLPKSLPAETISGLPASLHHNGPSVVNDLFNSPSLGTASTSRPSQRRSISPMLLSGQSESENEHPKTSPLTNTSDIDHTDTPQSNLSTTPPTTDAEASGSRSANTKKKRSLEELRRSHPPPMSPSSVPAKRRLRETSQRARPKKPTKKDKEEARKESARMASDKVVSIGPQASKKFSLNALLSSIVSNVDGSHAPNRATNQSSSQSDPIVSFSSPELSKAITLPNIPPERSDRHQHAPSSALSPEDSDDEFPASIFHQAEHKSKVTKEDLRKRKELLLAAGRQNIPDSDDDDLEIVPANPLAQKLDQDHSKSAEKRMSRTRKVQMQLAGVNHTKYEGSQTVTSSKSAPSAPSREQFERELLRRVHEEKIHTITKKQEAFEEAGGHIQRPIHLEGESNSALRTYALQGLETTKDKEHTANDSDEESSDADGEWRPKEWSTSPQPSTIHLADMAMGSDPENDMQSEEPDGDHQIKLPRSHRRTMILDSDDENDASHSPNLASRPGRHHQPTSPDEVEHDEVTPFSEDGTDKENNGSLVFDRSEDKENKAVVRFGSLRSSESLENLSLTGSFEGLSPKPQSRKPFQEMPGSSDTPKPKEIGRANLTQLFEAQLSEPRKTPELELSPFLVHEDAGRFSQFSQEEATLVDQPTSEAGLSGLFKSATQASSSLSSKNGLLEEAFDEKSINQLRGLARKDTLDLTQDLLQPAFQPKEEILRKANDIVEKEQGFVLDTAFRPEEKQPQLYVNEDGFLTQTRPNVPHPELYEPPSPLPLEQSSLQSRSSHRSPLATISFSGPTQAESPSNIRLKRLRKRSQSPSERVGKRNEGKRRNAFDTLLEGAHTLSDRKRRRLEKSEFVEEEAHESDDEGGFWGIAKSNDQDEEMDDEDLDKTLEALVDDKEMDEQTLAEHLVHEKFKEQEELEDKKKEEEAHNVAKGEWRKRRKDGGFLSDDSDDEQDEESRRARYRLRKQRKNREDVEALEADPETKAFAASYKSGLADEDDNEFSHLAQDDTEEVLSHLPAPDEDEDDEDESMDQEETVPSNEVRRLIRERAEQPHLTDERIDYNDIAWMEQEDQDEDDMGIQVKAINRATKGPTRVKVGLDPFDMDDVLESQDLGTRPENEQYHKKAQVAWAKRESRNRNNTTMRSGSSAAVTSHVRAKAGEGSLRRPAANKKEDVGETSKPPVKKAQSMLVEVDRSSRFE